MKKPVIIGASALALLAISATLFAQTTTGSSLITEMKAGVRAFTLTADLNPGATGLQSAPLVGKRTGDQLSAAEYNRLLELVGQGGAGNSELITSVFTDVTAGGVQKTYTCPDDMKVLSAKEVLVPSGISVCGIPIQADGKSVKYGGCNPSAGINWHATVVCGKVIGSGGTGGGTAGGTTEKQIVRIARNWGWTGVSSHLQSISGSSAWEVRTAAWDERCVADGYANGGWIIDMDSTAQVGFCAR